MERFDICWPYTLAQECPYPRDWSNPANFSNDAHDSGGKTMCGIIQREYTIWRKNRGLPSQDVRLISLSEGNQIYRGSYWEPKCPTLAPGLDLQIFDANVNEGDHEATMILQHVLGVNSDGEWGPETAKSLAEYLTAGADLTADLIRLVSAYTERRKAVYREMKGFQYFGRDWLRRADQIGAQSLAMVQAGNSPGI